MISLANHYHRLATRWSIWLLGLWFGLCSAAIVRADDSLVEVVHRVQPKVVKIYGAGGLEGLEAYQTGLLVSPEGHVLTVWSYVLDADPAIVWLTDGRRLEGHLLAADPITEIAVLKLDGQGESFPYFSLTESPRVEAGHRVLAFCNLFGIATGSEPLSVLHGHVSVVAPLEARRGSFETNYHGLVYVLDAMTNNPGAAGGAVTDQEGHLIGMIGKEVRSELTNTWLNFALPADVVGPLVEDMIAGKYTPTPLDEFERPDHPITPIQLGLVLVPDVVARTPPFIDRVLPRSPAEQADLRPDDLIVAIGDYIPTSRKAAEELLARFDMTDEVPLTVLRGSELISVTLSLGVTEGPSEEIPSD